MNQNDLFKFLFNFLFDDDLKSHACLCDFKKSVRNFYILRRGSDLKSLEFQRYFDDFCYFFKDFERDFDKYNLMFVFDCLFKWWFCYGFVISLDFNQCTFIDFLNIFYNFVRLNNEKKS